MDSKAFVVLAAAAALLAAPAAAQEAPWMAPGARVRVSLASGPPIEARLLRQDAEGLTLALPGPSPFAPSLQLVASSDSIQRLEVSLGQKGHALLGAGIGAVVLGLTGFSEPIDESGRCGYGSYAPCSRAEAVAVAAMGGAVIGAVVGHFVRSERWQPVPLQALQRAPGDAALPRPPGAAGFAGARPLLALSFRF